MAIIILLRSPHLLGGVFPSNSYDSIPTTLTMWGFLLSQPITLHVFPLHKLKLTQIKLINLNFHKN